MSAVRSYGHGGPGSRLDLSTFGTEEDVAALWRGRGTGRHVVHEDRVYVLSRIGSDPGAARALMFARIGDIDNGCRAQPPPGRSRPKPECFQRS